MRFEPSGAALTSALRVYFADAQPMALPPGHRFPAAKYTMLRQAVASAPPGEFDIHPAPAATEGELALAHTPGYIDAVVHGLLSPAQEREIGLPWSPAMATRALHSVGATIAAARAALTDGVAAQGAGGTHHAQAEKGSGFCVFNDVAVAARLMQARHHRHGGHAGLRVLVVDLDVHQGNGTAAIFAGDPSVTTFSMHGERNFPARKTPGSLDLGLDDGCGDDTYLAALRDGLDTLHRWHREAPYGLAFYLAGADAHEGDRLGRLRLTQPGLRLRDEQVFTWLRQRQIPVAVCMAGGYGADLAVTVAIHLATLQEALKSRRAWSLAAAAGVPRGG